ncbi:MAG: DGQHR domain-containing protein [Deltaproteobacteria bacterium]|nr:MAG: DGQHR domain-containing protein [Deltaproteobacteria bacterium]
MGFIYLNSGRLFKVPYSDDYSLTQQVDIIAIDKETILIMECKAAETIKRNRSFKEAIEAIDGKKEGILNTFRKVFPGSKHKVKFIFATKNYILQKPDIDRLLHFDIALFEEEEIEYYEELTTLLGPASKYQLLGNLFEGQKIPELSNKVPAVMGKLGSHTFYSFSIEPERLLKIGYVLHRTKANKELMPTYQRMVKKNRLKLIEKFISKGGFFPNSVVINIDKGKRSLKWDPADTQCNDTICRIGILSLPQKYRSAFIIDGQHRLYGYANTPYKNTNAIPVVAFENLARSDQVELFMQINENQKAVTKNLRNTLNADLLWNSNDLTEAIKALKLRIAQDLGDDKRSPLYGRVIIGENKKTPIICITIDTIFMAFNRSNFYGKVTKNSIKEFGTFYDSNVDSTFVKLLDYLILCFEYIRDSLPDQWELGEKEDGFLTINPTIYCLIVIFSDIIDHLAKTENLNPRSQTAEYLSNGTKAYLDPVIHYFRNLSVDEKSLLRRSYGTGGRTKYWRTLQQVIQETRKDFNPEGLEQYIKDSSKQYNTRSFEMIRDIETYLKEDIRERLEVEHGKKNWWKKGVPFKVYEAAEKEASRANRLIEDPEKEVEPWDKLHFIDYRDIILHNWRKLFEEKYAYPGVKGNKEERTKWLEKLNTIRNQNVHVYSVTEEEFKFLTELHSWVLP